MIREQQREMPSSSTGNLTLIFQHIPKTAGTTLSYIVTSHYNEGKIYHVRNLQQMRGPAYSRDFGSLDDFKNLPADERNRFHLILGHMPFGIHEYVENPFCYITFIRDPVSRVISQYGQHKRMLQVGELEGSPISLETFLETKPEVLHNHQTRFLSGWDFTSHTPDECYEKALQNIDAHCSLVGVVERFDESLLLLSKMFRWRRVTYFKRNIGTHRPPDDVIDSTTIEKIRSANHLDTRLHLYASRLLDEKIKAQGDGFEQDLKTLKRKLALYKKFRRASNLVSRIAPGIIRKLRSHFITTDGPLGK